MSLLVGLILAAAASGPIATAPTARVATPAPASSAAVTPGAPPVAPPLQEKACTPARLTCRHIDSFGMVVSPTQAITVQANKDLEYTAADSVLLMLGESAVFKVTNGNMVLVSGGKSAGLPLTSVMNKALGLPTSTSSPSVTPAAGQIRISLIQAPGRPDSFLFVENGYGDKMLDYKAGIVSVNNVEVPTNVCSVAAGKMAFVYWPYAVPSVRLNGFKQVDPTDVACQ